MLGAILSNELPIHRGPASVWRSVEPVAGTLTLTRDRLLFEPNALLIQGGPISIPLREIAKVEAGNSLFVFPNQLVVVRRSGRVEKFAVRDRDEWLAHVRHQLSARTH